LKKPHALIGLLAALGTAIGVLVAVVGLPYGRLNYTAFAGLYHNGGATYAPNFHVALDCDPAPGIQDGTLGTCTYAPGATVDVSVTLADNSASGQDVSSFNFEVIDPDRSRLEPVPCAPLACSGGTNLNGNPDFDSTGAGAAGVWNCGDVDVNPLLGPTDTPTGISTPTLADSFIACRTTPLGPTVTASHMSLAIVHYTVPGTALNGNVPLSYRDVAAGNNGGGPLIGCASSVGDPDTGPCFAGTVHIASPTSTPTSAPATATNTSAPTNTNTPAPTSTDTPTPTATPAGARQEKEPEGNANNVDLNIPAANLWLCYVGACAGPGEGDLKVMEEVSNVQTNPAALGLGAYEFTVEYDHQVIASLNPIDIVFSSNAGVTFGEPFSSVELPEPVGAGIARTPPTCSFSLILENSIQFGCVTTGQAAGPTGSFSLAMLDLIPQSDLSNDIFPGNNNGVLTVIKDNNCELADTLGHPVAGSINGGLLKSCGDLAITVRILEGDLNLDCKVDITDEALIAFRYGSSFGMLLYSRWFDLEPQFHDLDIDIKDIQKVFGRDGSTCQVPIPAQPPLPPPSPFLG